MSSKSSYHEPVLLQESLELLNLSAGKTILDCTLGGGGHSSHILPLINPDGMLIALDRDRDALETAGPWLFEAAGTVSVVLIHSLFSRMESALAERADIANAGLDGVLFDLGVSSHQLDTDRGFSFRRDERIDMRMDTSTGRTAADLLAEETEEEIARILWEFGEERFSRRIARTIVQMRQSKDAITTTAQLARAVEISIPKSAWPRDIHPATKTMMAIRIAINSELDELTTGLKSAVHRLKPGGRIVVISFHSLEDRIVKQAFTAWAGLTPLPQASSMASVFAAQSRPEPILKLITRKPIVSSDTETTRNPRARSARLRAAEKL